jgi:hypothetical protein
MSAVTRVVPPPHALTERIVDDVEPQAFLTLASTNRYRNWKHEVEHRAALAFTYNGHVAAEKKSSEILILSGTETLRIQRKPVAEKALRQALQKQGFKKGHP